jgi:hypothetical protein
MRILQLVLLAFVLVFIASAADVSGEWDGTFTVTTPDGQTHADTVHLVLKQSGENITGTAGPNAGQQRPIARGSIHGGKITLELPAPDGIFKFDIVLEGDHLKGDVTRNSGGESMRAKMDATRAK